MGVDVRGMREGHIERVGRDMQANENYNTDDATYCCERLHHIILPVARQFARLHEPFRHSLEVVPRYRTVLVEVNPVEVRLHLALPEVRHSRWWYVLQANSN